MLIKVIKKQTIFLLKQKEASLTFILLLAVVLGNYITNVREYPKVCVNLQTDVR